MAFVDLSHSREGQSLLATELTLIKRPANPGREWQIDRDRRCFLKNGAPFFPFGVVANVSADDWYFRNIASLGCNAILHWSSDRNPEQAERYLEKAAEHGLDVVFCPDREFTAFREEWALSAEESGLPENRLAELNRKLAKVHSLWRAKTIFLTPPYSTLSQAAKDRLYMAYYRKALPVIRDVVGRVRDAKNLMGYFILDEPIPETGQGAVGKALYAELNRLDGYRPVFVNYSSSIPGGREAVSWSDALGTDPYWIPGTRDAGARGEINFVSRIVALTDMRAREMRSVTWSMLMAEYWSRCNRRVMTPVEQKCQTYLALIHGARGLFFFSYPLESAALADGLRNLSKEVAVLGPACMTHPVRQRIVSVPEENAPLRNLFSTMQVSLKRHPEGGYILLAANTENYPAYVSFRLGSLPEEASIRPMFGGEERVHRNGLFVDRFSPYQARAYRVQSPPLPEPVSVTIGSSKLAEVTPEEVPGYNNMGRVGQKNLLPNPSFEEVSVKGWPDYYKKIWGERKSEKAYIGGPESPWGVCQTDPRHGRNCVFLKTRDKDDRVISSSVVEMVLERPTVLTFSAWLRASEPETIVDLNLGPYSKRMDKRIRVSAEWKRYHISNELPAGRHYVMQMIILRENPGKRTVWADCVQLEKNPEPTDFQE